MIIAYIGDVGYPNSAPSIHINNRARFFSKCGYEVYAVCDSPKNETKLKDTEQLKYMYMKSIPGRGKFRGFLWTLNQIFGYFSYSETKKILKDVTPDLVILYEPNSIIFSQKIRKLGKKLKFKTVIETTEWRNPKDSRGLMSRIIDSQKDFQKKWIDKRHGNIIAISEYLYKHYSRQGCNVIKLPPLFSEIGKEQRMQRILESRCGVKLRLVYAGSLSSKDFLEALIDALLFINKNVIRFVFDIIGPDKKDIEVKTGNKDLELYGIFCHGRLSHKEVLEYVEKADFSVLLRKNLQYAKAGVSTKFCEAMCLGVPSICTKVGGTDSFVIDGVNGFLIENNETTTIIEVLNKILSLSDNEIIKIKSIALRSAIDYFDMEHYIDSFKSFIAQC